MIYDTLVYNYPYPQIKEGNIEDCEVDNINGNIEIYYWLNEVYTDSGIEKLPKKKLMHVTMSIHVEQAE